MEHILSNVINEKERGKEREGKGEKTGERKLKKSFSADKVQYRQILMFFHCIATDFVLRVIKQNILLPKDTYILVS